MTKSAEEARDLENKLKGVMEFYVTTYLDYYAKKFKEEVLKNNVHVEQSIMESRIDDRVKSVVDEASIKFHDVCMFILSVVMDGREAELREFEVLFLDLIKRTLAKEKATPIILITEPNLGDKSKEN